jgi:hypothetical protein
LSFDGSGTYSLSYTFATEAASPPIAISKLDTEFAGIATALSLCVLRNGNGVPTASTPWNNQKITGLADAAAATDAMNRQASDARYLALSGGTLTSTLEIESTAPMLRLVESDAVANNGMWRMVVINGALNYQLYDDAESSGANYMVVARTGNTCNSITFAGTTIAVTGNATVSGTLAVTGAVTGASFAGTHTGAVAATTITASSTLAVTGNTTLTGTLTKASKGGFPYYDSATQSGGAITVSTSAASGTPAAGDLWYQYTA